MATNPELLAAKGFYEAMYGKGAYDMKWHSMSSLMRFWMTLRGFNPGGRKGAPALTKEA